MSLLSFRVSGKVAVHPGGGWHIVVLSKEDSARLGKLKTSKKPAWGYIRVKARTGETTWETSLWPKEREGVYLLVVTAPVRKKEGVSEGDTVHVTLDIL